MPEDQDNIYGVSSANKATMLYFTEGISIKMQNKNNRDIYYTSKWLRRWEKEYVAWQEGIKTLFD